MATGHRVEVSPFHLQKKATVDWCINDTEPSQKKEEQEEQEEEDVEKEEYWELTVEDEE